MTDTPLNMLPLIEKLRTDLVAVINASFDDLRANMTLGGQPKDVFLKMPTPQDGHDPRNKNGLNLTERGVEIIYRVFDDGGGYNRAAKMLNVSQGAAKNRKACWLKAGGLNRKKLMLDIDVGAA